MPLQDRTLRLWNPVKGLFIKEYRGHGYEVRDVSVCTDNSKMASVGGDRQVCCCSGLPRSLRLKALVYDISENMQHSPQSRWWVDC